MAKNAAQITLEEAIEDDEKVREKRLKTVFKDVTLERAPTGKIILPEGMTLAEAQVWLERRRQQDETVVEVNCEIDCYPIEGAYALLCALREKFGFVDVQTQVVDGFFGKMEFPSTMIGVEIEPGKTMQVPWGQIGVPGVEGYLTTSYRVRRREKIAYFAIAGKIKRKSEELVREITELAKKHARENSLFKGRAIQVDFLDDEDEVFAIDPAYLPKIMDVSKVRPDELIFPADVEDLVQTALFAPLEFTEACRIMQIPLKRGVLLEGPYGTGKTLTAWVTAKKATDNGWTFIYIKKATDLDRAVGLAKQYQPCAIFVEDVDSAVEGEERTDTINSILNTLDGIDAKSNEILVVLTTNHVENINQAMLRPGRLDTVIPVRAPDAPAVTRLIRLYARSLLDPFEDLAEAGKKLAGQIPAFIREAVERSKLSAIRHIKPGESLKITARDLVTAANGMMSQIALLEADKGESFDHPEESAADILGGRIEKGLAVLAASIKKAPNGRVDSVVTELAAG